MESKGYGKGGNCICVACEITVPHEKGVPCKDTRCPNCGKRMLRENSEHHQLYLKKSDSAKASSDKKGLK